jgi:osmotically-inducible protein OsmY
MTDRNDPSRDKGDFGSRQGTPATGLSLDDGRVQFAPRETDEGGPYIGRGPRGSFPADDQIAAQVCALMTSAGGVDASEVEVHTSGDEVTLEGTVGSEEERRLAENIALAVSSVRAVHNRLQVLS